MKTNTKKSIFALIIATALAIPTVFGADYPEDVTGVTATAVDSTSIGVSWDSATDSVGGLVDHYRIYYSDNSVQSAGTGDYESQIDTPNNNTSYVVTGLMPGEDYFFSVTAFDTLGEESESYSSEGSASTPAETDTEEETAGVVTSPIVVDVTVIDSTHIEIEFSENIVLPELLPEASFSIEEQINPSATLEVTSAMVDPANPMSVILETEEQTYGVNYIVTVGVSVKGENNNPIISGSTDSGLFVGSDVVADSEVTPVVEETTPVEPEETVTVEESICGNGILENEEECDDGNLINNDGCAETCVIDEDTTPPEDITSLLLSFKEQVESFIVLMDWTASVDSAKDLVDQIIYQSMDRGTTYDTGTALGAEATHYELPNMEGGKEYTFKIATKDDNGNESVGVVKSIRLPQTGLGIGFLLLGSAVAAGSALRRRKR
ncbi:fibronectin type III domain-containing protein [Candidatus Peregrinibacteria bacterium]|nr:fibronectin type III domain-containing protein [Candidatus Peregrinibacteria bacterium]